MGEQAHTPGDMPKPESQSQIEIPNQEDSKPLSDAIVSHNHPQNPSKIPIRPQKIRKLSNNAAATEKLGDDSSSSTVKNRRRSASLVSRVIIKPLSADGEIELAIRHLRAVDPLLAPVIDTHPLPQFDSHQLPFISLTRSILYQQLACKAGNSIYTRFVSLCGGEGSISPDSVLALSSQQLKQIGVSGRKASYLYDLANKYKSGILSDDSVVKMDDRSLFTMLSMVKGIGSWSVHMFMIFSLQRPDVLPVSDLAVRKGVQFLYGLDELPRPSQMEPLCEKWKPYRSVGAWYMWRFVEGKGAPTNSSGVMQPLQQIQDPHMQFIEPVNAIANLG